MVSSPNSISQTRDVAKAIAVNLNKGFNEPNVIDLKNNFITDLKKEIRCNKKKDINIIIYAGHCGNDGDGFPQMFRIITTPQGKYKAERSFATKDLIEYSIEKKLHKSENTHLFIFDCCNSGKGTFSINGLNKKTQRAIQTIETNIKTKQESTLTSSSAEDSLFSQGKVIYLAAAQAGQLAHIVNNESFFTYALKDLLIYPTTSNWTNLYQQLYEKIAWEAEQIGEDQRPFMLILD